MWEILFHVAREMCFELPIILANHPYLKRFDYCIGNDPLVLSHTNVSSNHKLDLSYWRALKLMEMETCLFDCFHVHLLTRKHHVSVYCRAQFCFNKDFISDQCTVSLHIRDSGILSLNSQWGKFHFCQYCKSVALKVASTVS